MASNIDDLDFIDSSDDQSLIDWSTYSEHYDELCNANPAYQELLADLSGRLAMRT